MRRKLVKTSFYYNSSTWDGRVIQIILTKSLKNLEPILKNSHHGQTRLLRNQTFNQRITVKSAVFVRFTIYPGCAA